MMVWSTLGVVVALASAATVFRRLLAAHAYRWWQRRRLRAEETRHARAKRQLDELGIRARDGPS